MIGYSVVSFIGFYVERKIGFSALKKDEWDLLGDLIAFHPLKIYDLGREEVPGTEVFKTLQF